MISSQVADRGGTGEVVPALQDNPVIIIFSFEVVCIQISTMFNIRMYMLMHGCQGSIGYTRAEGNLVARRGRAPMH